MRERMIEIRDISTLAGMVSRGILNRIINCGGVPERGPGSASVPNALRRAKVMQDQVPTTLEQRREQNRALNHRY